MSEFKMTKSFAAETDRQLTRVRFSPTEALLASGSFDGTVRWWLPTTEENQWQEQPPLTGHQGWVTAILFSRDGQTLFSADSWGTVRCWQRTETGWEQKWSQSEAHDGWILQMVIHPQGFNLSSCGRDGFLRTWNTKDGTMLTERDHRPLLPANSPHVERVAVQSLAVHPVSGSLVSGDQFGTIRVWEGDQHAPARTFDASELFLEHRLQQVGGVRQLAFSVDGQRLAAAGTRPKNGGNVQGVPIVLLFDWNSGEKQTTLELGTTSDVYVTDLLFHRQGWLVMTTSGNPGTGQVVGMGPDDKTPRFREKNLANCHSLTLDPEQQHLAVISTNKKSNGNGRRLNDQGEYPGNYSHLTIFRMEENGSS